MTSYLSPQVIAEQMAYFIPRNKFTKKSSKSYEEIAAQYIKTCGIQIKKGIIHASKQQLAQNQFPIDMDWLRDQNPNQYTYGGKRSWWFDWLTMTYPMFKIVQRGYSKNNKGQLTMAELIIPSYELQIGETAEETFKRIYGEYASEFENDQVEYVPINIESLSNYIERTQADTTMDFATRNRYELIAREILTIAKFMQEQTDLGAVLPHVPSTSAFGRVYYKGLNLQTTPSIVREAALGPHVKYDIVSSVFAWQLMMVNNQFLIPATKELVLERQRIRKMLAQDCIHVKVTEQFKVDIIKQAITALGFGAGLKGGAFFNPANNTWQRNAIAGIIMNPADRLRFQEHPWVQEFAEEQKKINQYIQSLVDIDSLPRDIDLFNKKNQVRTSKLMAYLYQHYEYDLVNKIRTYIEYKRQHDDVNYGWLLMVHDGFYLRHRSSGTFMQELAQAINPYVRIESQNNTGWASIEDQQAFKKIKEILSNVTIFDRCTDWSNKKGIEIHTK